MTTAGRAAAGLLAACVLVAAAVAGRAALSAGGTAPAASGRPRIEVEPRVVDFGNVLPGKTLSRELSVRNHGDGELRITKVEKTCDCTIVGTYTTVLAPGTGTQLRVSLTTPDTPGRTYQGVRIESNDPDQPKLDVNVEATVIAAPKAGR